MGKIESKPDIKIKKIMSCQIKANIMCPICNQILKGSTTYDQLNNHLKECELQIRGAQSERLGKKIKQNNNKNKTGNIFKEMIDDNYLNNVRMQSKKDDLINSEPHRGTHKKSINSDISDGNTINDFQLVIDYNNTKNPDLYEEKLKNDGKKEQIIDKYSQLRRFVMTKKNLMNYDLNIECHNYKEIFYAIKNSNIYYNIKFILLKNKNPSAPFTNKPKILSLNVVLNKYFEFMIKNKSYNLINETLFFSFNNNKVDYEMLGIILSILFQNIKNNITLYGIIIIYIS